VAPSLPFSSGLAGELGWKQGYMVESGQKQSYPRAAKKGAPSDDDDADETVRWRGARALGGEKGRAGSKSGEPLQLGGAWSAVLGEQGRGCTLVLP